MHQIILLLTTVVMGFFAIMNPIANTPIFMGLTSSMDKKDQRKVAVKSVLYAFIIVTIFIILGKVIFKLFGITLPAFQITGGILLFWVGYNMLQGSHAEVHQPPKEEREQIESEANNPDSNLNVALTPLAIPILAGPGTISTAMNFVGANSNLSTVVHVAVVVAAFAFMCFVTFILFISGNKIVGFLGKHVITVISKVMGLILAVIATQMVISGIHNASEMFFK